MTRKLFKSGSKRRRFLIVLLAVAIAVASPVFCCGTAIVAPQLANNLRLYWFAGNLYRYPLPSETAVISRRAALVPPPVTGNGCTFEAELSLASTLSREGIQAHYDGMSLPVFDPIRIRAQERAEVRIRFDESASSDGRLRFTVTAYDYELLDTLDVRCG